MLSMFDMIGNYEKRKVARYEEGDVFVSTARTTDSDQPYETAVAHPQYNDNKIVIVEMYDDKEAAKAGHEKWVKRMTAKELPEALTDVSTSEIAKIIDVVTPKDDDWRKNAKREEV